jgi:glycosyltransferase involved in cell wall biosynthesis
MIRLSSRHADVIITISESTKQDLLGIFDGMSGKVHAIPLAADSIFRPIKDHSSTRKICSRYRLQMGEYILFVGLLEPRKNVPTLLHAYRDLVDRGIRKQLAIVGRRGWMYDKIFSTLHSLQLKDLVVFTDYVPEEDLPYLYNGACLFVYPSLYEGFGLPVLEAMSCGTPVVTSNVSSMPEIVGDAGLLIDPHDSKQLARAMERIIADKDLDHSLRKSGLQRAADFSWERMAQETLRLYNQICEVGR